MRFWATEKFRPDGDIIDYVSLPLDMANIVDEILAVLDEPGNEGARLVRIGRYEEGARDLHRYQWMSRSRPASSFRPCTA